MRAKCLLSAVLPAGPFKFQGSRGHSGGVSVGGTLQISALLSASVFEGSTGSVEAPGWSLLSLPLISTTITANFGATAPRKNRTCRNQRGADICMSWSEVRPGHAEIRTCLDQLPGALWELQREAPGVVHAFSEFGMSWSDLRPGHADMGGELISACPVIVKKTAAKTYTFGARASLANPGLR